MEGDAALAETRALMKQANSSLPGRLRVECAAVIGLFCIGFENSRLQWLSFKGNKFCFSACQGALLFSSVIVFNTSIHLLRVTNSL